MDRGMDLGIIGNCQYNALIDKAASVQWLCWPRFDSSSVFGSLLDSSAGEFSIHPPQDFTSEQSYLTNTNILRTVFKTSSGSFEVIDFAPRFQQYHRTFHPAMLVRIVRPLSGEPTVQVRCRPTGDYGKMKPKLYWGSNHIQYEGFENMLRLTTDAPLTYIHEEKPFTLTSTKYFVLTWGKPLEAPLVDTCETFFKNTKNYWQNWVKHCAIPNEFQEEVIRSALVLKIHQFEDTGAIIAATTTSLPESPGAGRNWDYRFCWLRDAYFSLLALRHLGQFEELERFVEYLRNIAIHTKGEYLQPVYGISGDQKLEEKILDLKGYKGNQPVRVGNDAYTHIQNDIYGEMIAAISPLFLDKRFVNEDVLPPKTLLCRLLDHIEKTMEVKDAGIWEFRGIEQLHTFSLLMHWLGAENTHRISLEHEMPDTAKKALEQKERARKLIETQCWNENLKCFTGAASSEDLDASLFTMINLGFLDPTDPRAKQHVEGLEKVLTTDNNLIHRYVHNDDFGKSETTFTICTFWYVEALARIGQKKKARELFNRFLKYSNHVGLFSEDIHPKTLELWGNFPQTYSHVGLINAAFQISDE